MPVSKAALSLFLTTFGITFMMITAWEELLLVSTCAYWIEMSPMDFPSHFHSLSHIEMTLTQRYTHKIWMLPELTLIMLCVMNLSQTQKIVATKNAVHKL